MALETAPDPKLTSEELRQVELLSAEDIAAIDKALLAASSETWRKVAFVVGSAMHSLAGQFPGVPDLFFSQRVQALVNMGRLNSQGNLHYMRFAEVRISVS